MNKGEKEIKMLTVKDVQETLRIGRNKAYDIFAREDFPSITIGKRFVIEEEAFRKWLQEKRKKA